MTYRNTDPNLNKIVFNETSHGLRISAMLSRFGCLYVSVTDNDVFNLLWSGDNILAARSWCRQNGEAYLLENPQVHDWPSPHGLHDGGA